jgi:hypothetical protein
MISKPCLIRWRTAGVRSAALWWLMSKHSSLGGGGVPEMLTRLKRGDKDRSPRWERFTMRLLVGHLLAYSIPGNDHQKVSRELSSDASISADHCTLCISQGDFSGLQHFQRLKAFQA